MKTFKDNEGREWAVAINIAQVKRVKSLLGVDLYALLDGGFDGLAKLLSDAPTLVDVVYVLCRDQAEKRGVDDYGFGSAMAGDAILAARDAFVAELVDFFPDPRVRGALARVMEISRKTQERAAEKIEEILSRVDPDDVASKLIASSGASPASSASTQAP